MAFVTEGDKEYLCSYATPEQAPFLNVHQLGSPLEQRPCWPFSFVHSLWIKDSSHSLLHGFQIVDIPPDS